MNASILASATHWRAGSLLAAAIDPNNTNTIFWLAGIALLIIVAFVVVIVLFSYGKLWVQAVMSNAHVSLFSPVGMSLRQVHAPTIVKAKIMAMQAGVGTDPGTGITARRLEAHYLGGGDVARGVGGVVGGDR